MQNIINKFKTSLSEIYSETEISALIRLVIWHVTRMSVPTLLNDKNNKISLADELKIDEIISRLQQQEPIQYILKETEFYGLPFSVDNNVLIPRPETEELVEIIINDNRIPDLNILDIGTGSGAIAIALAKNMKKASVSGWDISEKAIEVATLNSELNRVHIDFRIVDILTDFLSEKKFNIVVSNPPYILESEKIDMSKNVLDFEPHLALFVPDNDPLLFYKRIADVAKDILTENGSLYFEINRGQANSISSMLHEKGYSNISIIKDLSKNDRIVKAEFRRL